MSNSSTSTLSRSTLSVYITNTLTKSREDLAMRAKWSDAFDASKEFRKGTPGGGKIWPKPETPGEGMLILTVQRDSDSTGQELNLGTTTLAATSLDFMDRFDGATWLSCQKRDYRGRVQAGSLPHHQSFREAVRSLSHPTSLIVRIDIWPSSGRERDEAILRSLDKDDQTGRSADAHMEGLVNSMLEGLLT